MCLYRCGNWVNACANLKKARTTYKRFITSMFWVSYFQSWQANVDVCFSASWVHDNEFTDVTYSPLDVQQVFGWHLMTVSNADAGNFSAHNYLRQGGNVFAGLCLSVCLCVCVQDNSKSCGRIFLKFWGYVGHSISYKWLNFGGDPAGTWILDHFVIFVTIALKGA